MPVTFKVADVTPVSVRGYPSKTHFLERSIPYYKGQLGEVIRETSWTPDTTEAQDNGFVHTVVKAYNTHHKLILRPDDVWLAIAVQFGFYVNARAEKLRHIFVSHQGKKELVVRDDATLDTAHYAEFLSENMLAQLKANVTDESLCDWILPAFSTTTANDKVVGSVVLMATLKSYFSYKMELCCGIPEITLLGTSQDWDLIRERVSRLREFPECEEWAGMLDTITGHFAEAASGTAPDLEFWGKICHYSSGGSGPSYLSGWLTAFCVFDDQGKWQGGNKVASKWGRPIDGQGYPVVNFDDVPTGYLTVPMKIDDNGTEVDTMLFAGHAACTVPEPDTLQPLLTWSIFKVKAA